MSKIRQVQKVFESLWIFMAIFCVANAIYEFVQSEPKKAFLFLGVAIFSLIMFRFRKNMRLKQEERNKNN